MKKKAIVLAVGALCAAPAAQAQIVFGSDQIGTVQFYGKLYPQVATFKADGSTAPGASVSTLVSANGVLGGAFAGNHGSRLSVDSQNSYLGFRGERALGSTGLKGLWQVEQSIDLENGLAGTFSNRNSFVGLGHGTWGTIKLGNMDTIYKEYGDTFSMFGIASGNFISASNVLSHIGIGNNNIARFHERRAGSIQYQTGVFGGFQAGIQYGPDELKNDPGRTVNADLWSYGVKWDSPMFYVSLQQERHKDFFGASNNIPDATVANPVGAGTAAHSKDVATRISGEVRLGGAHRIVADLARLDYKESGQVGAGRFQEYKKTNWALGYVGTFGPWGAAIQLVRAGAGTCSLTGGVACSASGLEATMVTLGVRYAFDRQTFLYAIAARLENGASARMDNWANGSNNRGSDPLQTAVGISYSF